METSKAAHHAAMLALYVSGDAEVSIVQAIKSAKQLEQLLDEFAAVLNAPSEPVDDEDDKE